jgi:hypothetical protein
MESAAEVVGGSSEMKGGFWARQISGRGTAGQRWFDVMFGMVAPLVCLMLDPGVLRTDGLELFGPLHEVRLFAYLVIAAGILGLGYFLVTRRASLFLAGMLYGAAAFSFALGVAILPMSVLGLLVVIGMAGFTPFVSGFVMWRNARRCREAAMGQRNGWRVVALGAVMMIGVSMGVQASLTMVANRAMARVVGGGGDISREMRTLRLVRVAARTDAIVEAYQRTGDVRERERLAAAYEEITGERMERRIGERAD